MERIYRKTHKGQGLVEYALLLVLVSIATGAGIEHERGLHFAGVGSVVGR
jgi:Flp pilus assembly pilin Flp